jgi:hypothetical protein
MADNHYSLRFTKRAIFTHVQLKQRAAEYDRFSLTTMSDVAVRPGTVVLQKADGWSAFYRV